MRELFVKLYESQTWIPQEFIFDKKTQCCPYLGEAPLKSRRKGVLRGVKDDRARRGGEAPELGGAGESIFGPGCRQVGGGLAQSREGERSLLASLSLLLLLEEKGMQDDADNDMEQTQGRGDIVRVVSPS